MKFSIKLILIKFVLFIAVTAGAAPVVIESKNAVATIVDGKASLILKGTENEITMKKGDLISEGDRVLIGENSRVEIKLADNSYVRFDEKTSFILENASVEKKKRSISIKLILGKAWANVTGLFGQKKGGFAISSKTVVAGVRGTVYRMNVEKDYASVVSVYSGEVECRNPMHKKSKALFKPVPVKGPHPISMKEWVVTLKSMQKVRINAQGKIAKPESFSEGDDNSLWVKWNRELDKSVDRGENKKTKAYEY